MDGGSGIPDLYGAIGGPDIADALAKHAQEIQAATLGRYQLARQLTQQHQVDQARQEAISNPSAETFNRLFVLDPEHHEAIKSAWGAKDADTQKGELRDLSAIRGYLTAGRPEEATKLIQRRIDADKTAGHDTADDEQMLSMITEDPDSARGLVDYQLAGVMGPDKWSATFKEIGDGARADQAQPSLIAKNFGEGAQAQANAAKTLTEAKEVAPNAAAERDYKAAQAADLQSQITNRAERLSLDRDTLETNTGLELQKLQQARELQGVQLSGTAETTMTNAVVAAEGSRQLANRASALADQLAGANLTGGWMSWLAQNGSGALGNPNLLRKEYVALVNSQAVKNLPAGPASDKDIAMAMKGFPPPTANAETMASFLRGMAKLQTVAANRDQARADWISDNGNLGRAKRDLTVNGVKVPAGATYAEWSASQAATERREAVTDRSYMRFGK